MHMVVYGVHMTVLVHVFFQSSRNFERKNHKHTRTHRSTQAEMHSALVCEQDVRVGRFALQKNFSSYFGEISKDPFFAI